MMNEKSPQQPFILFELGGTTYGVRSRDVQQMEMIENITPVPDAPPFVDGVVFSRGHVIPALSLRARFGLPKIPYDLRTRLIVMKIGDRRVGFVVDSAREFVSLDETTIMPPPEETVGLNGRYLEGIVRLGERLILILDLEEVLRVSGEDQLPEIDSQVSEMAASLGGDSRVTPNDRDRE